MNLTRACQLILINVFIICVPFSAGGAERENCYPITLKDILDKNAPTFEQFPVDVTQINSPTSLDLSSNPLAKDFRTVLQSGLSKGPNFADHYTLVGWGAGSSTLAFAIIDAKSGKVITTNEFSTVYFGARYSPGTQKVIT